MERQGRERSGQAAERKTVPHKPVALSSQLPKQANSRLHDQEPQIPAIETPASRSLGDQIREIAAKEIDQRPIDVLERKLAAKEAELRDASGRIRALSDRNTELSQALETYAGLVDQPLYEASPITLHKTKNGIHKAIPVFCWSDWHVAEVVDKTKTNGLNAYNPDVCQRRVKKLTENTLRMLEVLRAHVSVDECVFQLGGDFITGYIHPELAETNAMGPTEESYFAIQLLQEAVAQFVTNANLKKIRFVCLRGNHGRSTHQRRMQYKNDWETSYETLIYRVLADRFQDKSLEWVISRSDICYTELMPGIKLRSIHGHQVRYQGGVGGIAIPLTKWVYRQNQTEKALLTMLGHFHSYEPSRNAVICGSLKGQDEYAMSNGFAYEPPSQCVTLFDCSRQVFTARYPIFCE